MFIHSLGTQQTVQTSGTASCCLGCTSARRAPAPRSPGPGSATACVPPSPSPPPPPSSWSGTVSLGGQHYYIQHICSAGTGLSLLSAAMPWTRGPGTLCGHTPGTGQAAVFLGHTCSLRLYSSFIYNFFFDLFHQINLNKIIF